MWAVETVDDGGNEGLHIVMKKTKEEVLAWVKNRAPQDTVVAVDTVLGMELVEIRGERGEMAYFKPSIKMWSKGSRLELGRWPRSFARLNW